MHRCRYQTGVGGWIHWHLVAPICLHCHLRPLREELLLMLLALAAALLHQQALRLQLCFHFRVLHVHMLQFLGEGALHTITGFCGRAKLLLQVTLLNMLH
jgi:hypothetical protein